MDNRAGEMQVFLRVVEARSFSEAARLLMMAPSTVSKLINRMEERLGVRLLERSTRRLSLTAEGQIYYLITPTSPPKWRKPLPYLKKSHGRGEGDGP